MAICYTRKCCDGDLYVIANEMPAMIILLHIIYLVMSVSCNNLCASDQRLPLVFLDFLPPLVISPKVSCTSSIQSYVDCSHKMLLFYWKCQSHRIQQHPSLIGNINTVHQCTVSTLLFPSQIFSLFLFRESFQGVFRCFKNKYNFPVEGNSPR